jgi:hypothetical protein
MTLQHPEDSTLQQNNGKQKCRNHNHFPAPELIHNKESFVT